MGSRAVRPRAGVVRVGISGWRYPRWRGDFYPRGLVQKRELAYAASRFSTIELNGSFYSLQRPSLFAGWYDETPAGFVFAIKGSRYITHMLRLRNVEAALANFFAQGLFELREKLGPILWQLPPTLAYDREQLDAFFALLPRDPDEVAHLAKKRDARMKGRCRLTPHRGEPVRRLRHALEIRHDSFLVAAFVDQLRRNDVALVVSDAAGLYPERHDLTSDFVYIRLHGSGALYTSNYEAPALRTWADRIERWARGQTGPDAALIAAPKPSKSKDVFCYFDNDSKVYAPKNAEDLQKILSGGARKGLR